jgi:hypothetical protein
MLSREQWTKPSLDDFIAWLETKPRHEKYDWLSGATCACGQYGKSIGVDDWFVLWIDEKNFLWADLNTLAYQQPRTFGGLLDRALASRAAKR